MGPPGEVCWLIIFVDDRGTAASFVLQADLYERGPAKQKRLLIPGFSIASEGCMDNITEEAWLFKGILWPGGSIPLSAVTYG